MIMENNFKGIFTNDAVSLHLDALADIALTVGWHRVEFDDSKQRSITLRSWAQEFVNRHSCTDWNEVDYIDCIDNFATKKIDEWLKIHPGHKNVSERISDIHIYSAKNGEMYIRCSVDGQQQCAEKLLFADVIKFDDRTDRLELAARYFKDALQETENRARGLGR